MNKSILSRNRWITNNSITRYVKANSGVLIALSLIVITLAITSRTFFTSDNLISVLRQVCINTMLALGMSLVLIIQCIDLSIGSVLAISGCLCVMMINAGVPMGLSILLTLILGAVFGLVNGFLVANTRIPPFIITLATMQTIRGVAYLITNGKSIMCYYEPFGQIGTAYVGFIPLMVIVTAVFLLLASLLLSKTRFGRRMYAIGGNKSAAIYAGINVKKITTIVYILTGVFSSAAGIMLASRVYSAQPTAGQGYEANAIAAAVLGGVSFNGGIGTAGGVMAGALILGILNNGLNLLHVHFYWQNIIMGVIVLLSVYIDTIKSARMLKVHKAK